VNLTHGCKFYFVLEGMESKFKKNKAKQYYFQKREQRMNKEYSPDV
jgi:hypothetical protein